MRSVKNGDTIVEVMVAIAVVSAIMASAFVTVNHTTNNVRQNQDHGEALKYVEAQIEQLSGLADDPAADIFGHGVAFCITSAGTVQEIGTAATLPAPYSSYDPGCKFGANVPYYVGIVYTPASNTFTATVTWDGINSRQDNISLVYKLYP